jgi:hypothetical protein
MNKLSKPIEPKIYAYIKNRYEGQTFEHDGDKVLVYKVSTINDGSRIFLGLANQHVDNLWCAKYIQHEIVTIFGVDVSYTIIPLLQVEIERAFRRKEFERINVKTKTDGTMACVIQPPHVVEVGSSSFTKYKRFGEQIIKKFPQISRVYLNAYLIETGMSFYPTLAINNGTNLKEEEPEENYRGKRLNEASQEKIVKALKKLYVMKTDYLEIDDIYAENGGIFTNGAYCGQKGMEEYYDIRQSIKQMFGVSINALHMKLYWEWSAWNEYRRFRNKGLNESKQEDIRKYIINHYCGYYDGFTIVDISGEDNHIILEYVREKYNMETNVKMREVEDEIKLFPVEVSWVRWKVPKHVYDKLEENIIIEAADLVDKVENISKHYKGKERYGLRIEDVFINQGKVILRGDAQGMDYKSRENAIIALQDEIATMYSVDCEGWFRAK